MKSVLVSIQPKWCELIASGEKTMEVRKGVPRKEVPFKCYIYETKIKQVVRYDSCDITYFGRGKVIGEFVCNKIDELYQCNSGYVADKACLSKREFFEYLGIQYNTHGGYDKKAFGWHISDLRIYDKPKELENFLITRRSGLGLVKLYLSRPPQSWCYVEVKP